MATSPLPEYNALNAAASVISPQKTSLKIEYARWQSQVWDYYDRLGEYEAGVAWKANSLSRVRLLAAELQPSGQKPVPMEEGPAADAVQRLAGGIGGQAELMRQATVHLSVPGEGWMVGEVDRESSGEPQLGPDGRLLPDDERWQVYSADELRRASSKDDRGHRRFEVREDESSKSWRPIDRESVVVRFWKPHARYKWRADSPGRHAMGDLAELDAINMRILATLSSRLAMNGILAYDKKRAGYGDAPSPQEGGTDPFADMFVTVASKAMKDPMSPEALLPIPVGFNIDDPADVDFRTLIQLIRTSDAVDDKLLNMRESAIKKLASTLDMPAEVLLGMSGLNHWGQWQIEESGIKIHIAPMAELLCYSLTTGFLVPTLKAGNHSLRGPNGGRLIVWYDPSEIEQRPDKSDKATTLNDRLVVSDRAARREAGFDEEDAPTQDEFDFMVARRQALSGTGAAAPTQPQDTDATGPPDTDGQTPDEAEPVEPDMPASLALRNGRH